MRHTSLLLLPLFLGLGKLEATAQTTVNNANYFAGSSDNTGTSSQSGTEVLASSVDAGISFAPGGSFEHIGQFYVAKDGIWNGANIQGADRAGTDYFGYAPKGIGSNRSYSGKGIRGASSVNGGVGTGKPVFGHLQLNSTGDFPVAGGMQIIHSLSFDANGPGLGNVITTPNATNATAEPVVSFKADAIITGANEANYINGFARVADPQTPFTLPIGSPQSVGVSFHPLTINWAPPGSVTARYLSQLQHPATARGEQIGDVYPTGNWQIDAPAGTQVMIRLSDALSMTDMVTALRLVGWNGTAWVDLSSQVTASTNGEYSLRGTLTASTTDLAIGLSGRTFFREESADFTVWPNPTRGKLTLRLVKDEPIQSIRILDLTGQPLSFTSNTSPVVDTSSLPTGSYIVEARTTTGQALRRRFTKQ